MVRICVSQYCDTCDSRTMMINTIYLLKRPGLPLTALPHLTPNGKDLAPQLRDTARSGTRVPTSVPRSISPILVPRSGEAVGAGGVMMSALHHACHGEATSLRPVKLVRKNLNYFWARVRRDAVHSVVETT